MKRVGSLPAKSIILHSEPNLLINISFSQNKEYSKIPAWNYSRGDKRLNTGMSSI